MSCVYEGLIVPIDAGLRIEARYFTKLLMQPESRNMIRTLFLSMQELGKGARRPAEGTEDRGEDGRRARRGRHGLRHRLCLGRRPASTLC